MNFRIYRHGDVALVPVELAGNINPQFRIREIDTDGAGNPVLAYGETSGHYHAVPGANVVAESGGLILEVTAETPAAMRHLGYSGPLEHADIQLPPGRYVPVQQHEYDIVAGWRAVVD